MIKHISSLELYSAVDYKYPFTDSNAKKMIFSVWRPNVQYSLDSSLHMSAPVEH